jgi:hypothetical protein
MIFEDEKLGSIAYEAYRSFSDGKSLISGQPIPDYDKLPQPIKDAWMAAAKAVYRLRILR